MKAVIMAGGEGTRLRPLTCNLPKPMMPILDKPVMQYTVELLKKHGITDIAVTLQYLPDEVIRYFGDGKDFGVSMRYFIEEFPLGTAGSVKNGEDFLDETFIVVSGDALTDINLSRAINFHRERRSTATLVLKEVAVPLEYGVVVTDKEGKIKGFLEKPSWGEVFSDKANTGIYILEPEIFSYYEKDQKFDFSNDLFPIILRNNKPMYGFVDNGYWCDIGNIEQYMRCHFDILKGIVKVDIKGDKYGEGIWIGENCEISSKASLEAPAYIGSGCKIYGGAEVGPFSVLGKSNIVSVGTKIKRSVLLNNCYIGSNNQIKGAVLCNNVQLESKVSVFEDCAIGDETLIGERTVIKPGVRIWPNKNIESSTVIKENVIWGGKFSRALFGKCGISGEVNVDITPEFVSKLGSAYGSILKPESKVAISCSDNGAAQMFKYSLAAGLLSMGVEVYDLKKMVAPMTRYAALFFGVQGAVHVRISEENPQKVNILFMDANGCDIDKAIERKIGNSFVREDFRRVKTDDFKIMTHMSECAEYYTRQLINGVGVRNIRGQRYKVVLCVRNSMLLSVVQNIFSELRITVQLYNEYNNLLGLSREVVESGAALGINLSEEGESAVIIDEKGNIIKDSLSESLNALVLLKSTKLKTLVVPVTSSSVMEEIANACGAKFIRAKTSQKSILESYIKHERKISRREIVYSFLMSLDSLGMCIFTINLMASTGLSLSNITSKVPRYYNKRQDIICPWNMKGKVMRSIIEENNSKSIDLIEGVKLNYDNGWVLILPDPEEPLCRVYVEAKDIIGMEGLSQEFVKRIECITEMQREELA
jgi:mannose-1-phosphate guanylyltransferase / phosphomannomutase